MSTQDMAKLFDLAGELNARVVAVGDHKQMASVSRGSAFRALQDIAHLPVAEVSEIKRQTVWEYKDAVKSLAEGKTAEGFDKLDKLGWIKLLPVWDQYRPVAESYAAPSGKKTGLPDRGSHARGSGPRGRRSAKAAQSREVARQRRPDRAPPGAAAMERSRAWRP